MWDGRATSLAPEAEIWVDGEAIGWIGRAGSRPVPDGARTFDFGGACLTPGLIDSHVHLFGVDFADPAAFMIRPLHVNALEAVRDLRVLLHAGITGVRCLGSPIGPALAQAVEAGHVAGPRILAAGQFICRRGGPWDFVAWPQAWVEAQGMYADGVDDCIRRVRERVRQGAGFIKVGASMGGVFDFSHAWGDDPDDARLAYSDDEMAVLIGEAHRNRMKVAVHAIGDAAVQQAARLGADVIEHGHCATDETYRRVSDRGIPGVPTLAIAGLRSRTGAARGLPARGVAVMERHLARQMESLRRALDCGVTVAAGTDSLGGAYTPFEEALCWELELLVEAGLTPHAALRASVETGAALLDVAAAGAGILAPGRPGDILAVPGDPLASVSVFRRPGFVMKAGAVHRHDAGFGMVTPADARG
jgi:imidazolonepropionase-like amidohydrolase